MCNCGGASSPNVSGTSTSLSSFSASGGGNGYIVYRPDGSTKNVSTESEARMAVAASGGTYRKA